MSIKDDLIAAKALIDAPEKWTKGHYEMRGCFCAVGALLKVTGLEPDDDPTDSEKALIEALPALSRDTEFVITSFNDAKATTHADIMALFDRAIEAQP